MALLVLLAAYFLYVGTSMHREVATQEAAFHAVQTDYFVHNDKATRDAAPVDSTLARQHAVLKNTPSELMYLKLVWVGKMLTAIAFLLFGIMIALFVMPMRLGILINKHS